MIVIIQLLNPDVSRQFCCGLREPGVCGKMLEKTNEGWGKIKVDETTSQHHLQETKTNQAKKNRKEAEEDFLSTRKSIREERENILQKEQRRSCFSFRIVSY